MFNYQPGNGHLLSSNWSEENRQVSATIWVSARTLRLAVEHGEIAAEHPFPDGPWIFNRNELQSDTAVFVSARARAHHC